MSKDFHSVSHIEPRGPIDLKNPATFVFTVPLFSDLTKEAKDLFSKDFPVHTKLELTAGNVTSSLTRETETVSANVTVKAAPLLQPIGGTLSTTLDSNSVLKAEYSKITPPDGKVIVVADWNVPNSTQTIKATFELRRPIFSTSVSSSFSPQKGFGNTSILTSATFAIPRIPKLFTGVETEFNLGSRSFKKAHLQAAYKTTASIFSVFTLFSGINLRDAKVGGSFFLRPSNTVFTNPEVGVQIESEINKPKDPVTLTVALASDISENTRGKVKVDTRLNSSWSLVHKLNKNVKITIGVEADARSFQVKGTGITLSFTE